MDINQFNFETLDGELAIFGMHFLQQGAITNINLFDLEENEEGIDIKERLWMLRSYILKNIFDNRLNKKQTVWTLTKGQRTTDIDFEELNDQPHRLSLSNKAVFYHDPFSLDQYSAEYSNSGGKPIHQSDRELTLRMVKDPEPVSVLAIPCSHAKDGVFYCKPPYQGGPINDDFEYILVDTQKLIERINEDDPEMLDHARYKYSGNTIQGQIEHNSFEYPKETGAFVIGNFIRENNNLSPGLGITLNSGNAGMLIAAQELGLPFIPIAIEKNGGQGIAAQSQKIEAIKKQIGYLPEQGMPFQPRINRLRL